MHGLRGVPFSSKNRKIGVAGEIVEPG